MLGVISVGAIFLSGCMEQQQELPPTPSSEVTGKTEDRKDDAPLYFSTMTHMDGGFKDDRQKALFLEHVPQLRYGTKNR